MTKLHYWNEIGCRSLNLTGVRFSLKQEITTQPSLKSVLDNHKDLFKDGYGKIRDFQARIRVERDIKPIYSKPIFHKPQPVPYALREEVEKLSCGLLYG